MKNYFLFLTLITLGFPVHALEEENNLLTELLIDTIRRSDAGTAILSQEKMVSNLEYIIEHPQASISTRAIAYLELGELCLATKRNEEAFHFLRTGISLKHFIPETDKPHLNNGRLNLIRLLNGFLPLSRNPRFIAKVRAFNNKLARDIIADYIKSGELCHVTTYTQTIEIIDEL